MTFYLLDLSCQVNCHCGNFVDHLNVYSTGYHEQFEGNIFDVKRREECFFRISNKTVYVEHVEVS